MLNDWSPAPIKTQWGADMVVRDIELTKDHTASVYCEKEVAHLFDELLKNKPD